jgi:ABC-2 type transport system permease protein
MVNKTLIIIKHEFFQAIRKTGYIILTLIIPAAALLTIGVGELVSALTDPPVKETTIIGYVDSAGFTSDRTGSDLVKMIPYGSREGANQALITGEISEYIVIPPDYIYSGNIQRYTQAKELITPPSTVYFIESFVTRNLIEDDLAPEIINQIVSPINLEVIRLDEKGKISDEQGSLGNIIIPGIYAFLLTMTFQFGATSLISGLGEEKESRLIEVLYSSVSVRQMLVGKIVALGTAGLLQVLIWLTSAPLLLKLASASFGGLLSEIQIPSKFIILGVIYFVLGYLQFAILSVTMGGISSNANEAHSLSMIYILAGFIPLWSIGAFINFPENPVWIVLSIIPVTAPIQTMLRLGVSEIPNWQIATSLGVLSLSVIAGIFLSEKVFRTFMLMYGKRPRLGEIIRGLRNT